MGLTIYPPVITDVPVLLSEGGTGEALSDPGADRVLFWDDSAGDVTWLTMGSNLAISGTTLNASDFNSGYTTTATAAGSTTLTSSSTFAQYFTGVTTQTIVLPVTSTLALGFPFLIVNNSTGLVTINSSGGSAVKVLGANTWCLVTCILITGTSAASWNPSYSGVNAATGKVATINNSIVIAGTDGTTITLPATTGSVPLITPSISDGDTTHSPDGNSVFDALALKRTGKAAATAVARLALTGLERGAEIYQTDTGFSYILTNPVAPSDVASWQAIPKKWIANFTFDDPPTATADENSIGAIVLSRESTGSYNFTLTGAFAGGTYCTATFPYSNAPAAGVAFMEMSKADANTCILTTFDLIGAAVDAGATASVQILTYPA